MIRQRISKIAGRRTPRDAKTARPVAVVDIGAGVIRLEVADISNAGSIHTLESLQQPVNLGKDIFTAGHIDPATIEECVDVLQSFRRLMSEYGVAVPGEVRIVATSAVREAENRQTFLDRVLIAAGLTVEVLEDSDVELLIHLALRELLERDKALRRGGVLAAEVGGGATRLLFLEHGYVTYSGAFRLGMLRTRETLATYRTPALRLREVLDEHFQRIIGQMRQAVPADQAAFHIALAGDIAPALAAMIPGWAGARLARLSTRGKSLAEKIVSTPVDKLMVRYRLPSQDVERAGFTLLAHDRIARAFGAREVLLTDLSLRRGLLLQMAQHESNFERHADQLAYSAMALGRKYHFDEAHAQYVAMLAGRLFDALADIHALGPRHAMLLRTAAILHDIGAFVGVGGHHKHSQYLIMNSDIFSLTRRDTALVAMIARYHRRAVPQASHAEYMALPHDDRIAVLKLAALLRIADALDRSHACKFRRLECRRERRRLVIAVHSATDATIERAALRDKASMFESVYGLQVVLENVPGGETG